MNLMINPVDYAMINEHLDKGKKIAAIKHLRKSCIGIESLGLREAKQAIERMTGQDLSGTGPIVIQSPRIKQVVLDMGDGEVTVDLETMELLILKDVERLGLESCGSILDFVHTLKAWSEGRPVGVLGEGNEDG